MQEINIKMSIEEYSNTMLLLHNWIQVADSLKGQLPEGNELRGIFENLQTSWVWELRI